MAKATERMRALAEAIAEELMIDEPDYDDFEETKIFIEENKYYLFESRNGKEV